MSDFKDRMYAVRRNPALMSTVAYTELDSQLGTKGSYDVPDGTIPFVWAMELGAIETAMCINEMEAYGRKLYTRLAIDSEEAYLHMSDIDFIGRFASPAQTEFLLYLDYEEVLSKAVAWGTEGIRKLVIPRLTQFEAAGLKFTMQYPLELRVMRHGGIQVEYDLTVPSPIETLATNLVTWEMKLINRARVMELRIPVKQFAIESHTDPVNPSSLFQNDFAFSDQFYFARCYLSDDETGEWREIQTTHSDQVYDPLEVTAVLQVVGNRLSVVIPPVYTFKGMATGQFRIDIYTTLGYIERDLASYRVNQFKATFNDIDDDSTYVDPIKTFTINNVLNVDRVVGGSNSMGFEALRNQIIENTLGPNNVPITNVQLSAELTRRGYALVSNIDQITNRQFLASRRLGEPVALDIISGAGTVMSMLQVSMVELAQSAHVKDNGPRITLLPSMLYNFQNGKVTVVPDAQILSLVNASAENKVRLINDARYVYSPFHYVLDASSNNFDCRPYYLDNPMITQKYFVGENDTAQMQASIDLFEIHKVAEGYQVQITLVSDAQFKTLGNDQVAVQIGYQPDGETAYVSVNGRFTGLTTANERVFTFDINTDYDINALGQLFTTNMSMYSEAQNNYGFKLQTDLDVTILVTNTLTPGYQPNDLDAMVQSHLLPNVFMVVNRERLATTFGYDMSRIWRRNRTIASAESYQKWAENVQAYWATDKYLEDENGNVIITLVNDVITYTKVHSAGDPVVDSNGDPVWQYLKGDTKLDANGEPILLEPRKIHRELTLFMVDGLFYFVTEDAAVAYQKEIPMELVSWVQSDIDVVSRKLLSDSKMFLYPTNTFGETLATVKDGLDTTITIDQAMAINFYLSHSAYSNATIRPALTRTGKQTINDMFGAKKISVSDIITSLKATSGEDVLAIEVSGLGGKDNFPVLTVNDDAVRLALRKKLVVLANQELTVEDDITFNYLRHTLPTPV